MEMKAGSEVGRGMLLRAAREKRRVGDRAPSRCMWCSHFGRAARNRWRASRHIVLSDWMFWRASGCGPRREDAFEVYSDI